MNDSLIKNINDIIIYSTEHCPYCQMAKDLLKSRDMKYIEKMLKPGSNELMELVQKTHHRTVPQIFIGEEFIGGYDDLQEYIAKKEFL